MNIIGVLRGRLQALFSDRLVRNIGWYTVAEGTAKLSRLVATVALARLLTPVELGTAAIAITCFEIIRVFANNGIGQMVIRASADRLEATCNTAYRASVIVCVLAALMQVVTGGLLVAVTGRTELFGLVAALGVIYLVMIPGLLPVYLLLRQGRLQAVAVVSTAQTVADNALTTVFALAGFGPWSLLLPRIVVAPMWLFGVRYYQKWQSVPEAGEIPLCEVFDFSYPIIASEMLAAARINIDKILVWWLLGVEALGVYFFAFNAGIGLSMSLTTALSNSIYPELARLAAQPAQMLARFDRALRTVAAPIAVIIAVQAMMTFVYVPVVFGSRWTESVMLVAMLCASAITKPFCDAAGQLLRAAGRQHSEFYGSLIYSTLGLAAFGVALMFGLTAGVATLALVSLFMQAGFTLWARRCIAREIERPETAAALCPQPA